MRIHVLQHVSFEDSANIGRWAARRGHTESVSCLYRRQALPPVSRFDWLVVMGGPMSVHDEKRHPWLVEEKRLIAEAISAGRLVLGVCLGAQLVAQCLGAKVKPSRHREIGWSDISLTPRGAAHPLFASFDSPLRAFHWHGETFTIPRGAKLVASSKACRNQAFVYGENVVGLQFHWDYTPGSISAMIANCSEDLDESQYVQPPVELLRELPRRCKETQAMLDRVLDGMAAKVEQ